MLSLRDVVEIEAPPERVFAWFQHLDDNYRSWHPDHVSCRYLRGRALEEGSVLCAEEYLHGRLHRLKLALTAVDPGRSFAYRIFPGFRGGFRMQPTDRGTEFTAELFFGWSIPVLGVVVDAIVKAVLSKRLEAMRQHMREEGVQLCRLLSEGKGTG